MATGTADHAAREGVEAVRHGAIDLRRHGAPSVVRGEREAAFLPGIAQ